MENLSHLGYLSAVCYTQLLYPVAVVRCCCCPLLLLHSVALPYRFTLPLYSLLSSHPQSCILLHSPASSCTLLRPTSCTPPVPPVPPSYTLLYPPVAFCTLLYLSIIYYTPLYPPIPLYPYIPPHTFSCTLLHTLAPCCTLLHPSVPSDILLCPPIPSCTFL